jgi:hypothetical protein
MRSFLITAAAAAAGVAVYAIAMKLIAKARGTASA